MSLTVRADRRLIRPDHHSRRHLLAELVAPDAQVQRERPPVNLAFVLDRSGSMAGQKIQLAHRAVDEAIKALKPSDRFAVVVYDDRIDVVMESTPATPDARRIALERLREIDARGSTNLFEGWLRGCEQVALHQDGRTIDRVLLLTDGLANVGVTDRGELESHAAELRTRGVSTTTFGIGADFDEDLLQAMADAGRGHFYYIESAAQIRDLITSEVGETLEVVARDAMLEVAVPAGTQVEALSPFPCRPTSTGATIALGDLVARQELAVVLRLVFPYGTMGASGLVTLAARDRDGALASTPIQVAFDYAPDHANDVQARDRSVDRAVAHQYAGRARQEAVALNREGRYQEAAARLRSVRQRIAAYAGDDPELQRIVAELTVQEQPFAAAMAEPSRKQVYAQSTYLRRMRTASGAAMRKPG